METESYTIKTSIFEGPFSLLLYLVEKRKLFINDLSLVEVTEDYLNYLNSLEKLNPEEVSNFLIVASTLLLIKSKSLLPTLNLTDEEKLSKIDKIKREIKDFDEIVEDERIMTITDLESYMIVKERLVEANDFLDLVKTSLENNNTNLRNLGYAMERVNSAKAWFQFLDNTGKQFNFNEEVIENACRTKLSEVEERLQYVQLYFPQNLEGTRKELEYAYQDLREGNHELCLFKASKAKANVDTVLSVFGV